jgi:hypothetical protein
MQNRGEDAGKQVVGFRFLLVSPTRAPGTRIAYAGRRYRSAQINQYVVMRSSSGDLWAAGWLPEQFRS